MGTSDNWLMTGKDLAELIHALGKVSRVRIVSPYLTQAGWEAVRTVVDRATSVEVIARLELHDWIQGASDYRIYRELAERAEKEPEKYQVFVKKGLHAKAYVFGKVAMLGSFNLSEGGLGGNLELGVRLEGPHVISLGKQLDLVRQASSPISRPLVAAMIDRYKELVPEDDEESAPGFLRLTGYAETVRAALLHPAGPSEYVAKVYGQQQNADRFLLWLGRWDLASRDAQGLWGVTSRGRSMIDHPEVLAEAMLLEDSDCRTILGEFSDVGREFMHVDVRALAVRLEAQAMTPGDYDSTWAPRISWLSALGLLDEFAKGRDRFRVTDRGHALMEKMGISSQFAGRSHESRKEGALR